ncbi:MAG: hypothetical protein ACO1PZ_17845 [Gammaproteobacteria bacterium]
MNMSRRSLLQYTGAGCALALLAPAFAGAGTLRVYEVRDDVAAPRFVPGVCVIADASTTTFSGDGLYLYPAWGEPRLYAVHAAGAYLEFRNPGSGQLLWTQSAGFDGNFAARVVHTAVAAAAARTFPALAVPGLPA